MSSFRQLMMKKKGGGANFTGLCFTAEDAGAEISWSNNSSVADMYLSTDGVNWNAWSSGSYHTFDNIGDKIYVKGAYSGQANNKYLFFNMTSGRISASGNLYSILDGDNFENITTISTQYCFYRLFKNCTLLTTPPELPATAISRHCYDEMFNGCSGLRFAPELPSVNLANYCYNYMFAGCSSLEKAPYLPAKTLKDYCYNYMFNGCSSLNYIKIAYTNNFSYSTYYMDNWVNGVSASGDFYYNGSDTTTGVSAIPNGWTVHTF